MKNFSDLSKNLKQSAIRSVSLRCAELGGVNLGQGLCDIPVHADIKQAAKVAIENNKNLYAPHQGIADLRMKLVQKIKNFNHIQIQSEREILISHGSTGAFVACLKSLFNPGDEVILFEPFYGYHKSLLELSGVAVRAVPISLDDFILDIDLLEKTISSATKGLVICTPCNPSGKVFTKEELITLGRIAQKHGLYVITDEIYEYITYPGFQHVSLASLEDFSDFTITISGFSKTYNVTGWRVGYAYGPEAIIQQMSLVHDLLYICPPTPLQHALSEALLLDEAYYTQMREKFLHKRDLMLSSLRALGFPMPTPEGAYYLMMNGKALGIKDDLSFSHRLLEEAKVATVPGRAFYLNPADGAGLVRLCYALEDIKLEEALHHIREVFS